MVDGDALADRCLQYAHGCSSCRCCFECDRVPSAATVRYRYERGERRGSPLNQPCFGESGKVAVLHIDFSSSIARGDAEPGGCCKQCPWSRCKTGAGGWWMHTARARIETFYRDESFVFWLSQVRGLFVYLFERVCQEGKKDELCFDFPRINPENVAVHYITTALVCLRVWVFVFSCKTCVCVHKRCLEGWCCGRSERKASPSLIKRNCCVFYFDRKARAVPPLATGSVHRLTSISGTETVVRSPGPKRKVRKSRTNL